MFEHVTTIEQLVAVAHQMAVDKGWWPGGSDGRSVAEQVNNFHSEIAEAWREYRHGRMELWFSENGQRVCGNGRDGVNVDSRLLTWKPEGFWVEIADLIIRLCDTAGAYGWNVDSFGGTESHHDALVRSLNCIVAKISWIPAAGCSPEWLDSADRDASFIVGLCFNSAAASGVDLWQLIRLKLSYNATREHRHGGMRA